MQRELPLSEMHAVVSGDALRRIDVDVVRSARRRSMAVHVGALGQVEVRVPLHMPAARITAFLDQHRVWILRKVAEAAAQPPWAPRWQDGGDWFWAGVSVPLRAGGRRGGELREDGLYLPLPAAAGAADWRRQVLAWHRRAAAPLLTARAGELFAQHCAGHRLVAVELRWMRTVWGTCGGRRAADGRRDVTLRLNPWLSSLPPHLCDSVLLHELAHVEHMHHGAAFYRRLARLNPAWREHDEELRLWSRRLLPLAARPA